MLNSKELPELIMRKMHKTQVAEIGMGETMRQILSQLKELNERDRRAGNRGR